MRETKFIEQNRQKWAEFEQMLRDKRRDPDKLNDLFIQITDDLSYARTFYPNRSVRMYLNGLAQRVFQNIYRGKRFPAERLRRFWSDELPQLMWESRKVLLLAFGIFILAFAVGVTSSIISPDFARQILGDEYVEMTLKNIQNGDPMAVYKDSGPFGMSVGIAANNLFVALWTAILGVVASVGTIFMLLRNGIMVGAFQYFFIERGIFWESFLTIWIHGTLEISAIIIAGAAGLVAGSGLLFPGTYRRTQAFQISIRRGMKIFFGVVPIIILAAIFEGVLTRYTATPDVVRGSFILVSLFFVLWYFVWLPWHKAKTNSFQQPVQDKELPPDRVEMIDFNRIKASGEIFSDTITVLRRRLRRVMLPLLALLVTFLGLGFGFSDTKITETFPFSDGAFGVLEGSAGFFSNEHVPFIFWLQMLLLPILAIAAFRIVEQEMESGLTPARSRLQWVGVWLSLVLPMMLFGFLWRFSVGGFSDESGLMDVLRYTRIGWFITMCAFSWLGLWGAVIYFDRLDPFRAIGRTFHLMRWRQGLTIGFLTVMLCVLLTLFLSTQVWDIFLNFFSWLVPAGGENMAIFSTLVTTGATVFIIYLGLVITVLTGAWQFFSYREIVDAVSLQAGIEQIGTARQIRGLARE
ncbi:MAG: stage II sporulation protein M [Saprospiraceae bacterium]